MGGDRVDRGEDWLHERDVTQMSTAGRTQPGPSLKAAERERLKMGSRPRVLNEREFFDG